VTATTTPPVAPDPAAGATPRPSRWRYVVTVIVVLFAAFWVWALFFASKQSINEIGDSAWAARAESICTTAVTQRGALADYRVIQAGDAAMLAERGNIIDKATDIIEQMLDDVVAVAPADPKGIALVPEWEADYRTYLRDRRAFAVALRAGKNDPFAETAVEGVPISARLTRFAADNHMAECAPPTDLS
jgi:hypothetical protein